VSCEAVFASKSEFLAGKSNGKIINVEVFMSRL